MQWAEYRWVADLEFMFMSLLFLSRATRCKWAGMRVREICGAPSKIVLPFLSGRQRWIIFLSFIMLRQRMGWGLCVFCFGRVYDWVITISMLSTSTDAAVWVHSSSAWQQPAGVQLGQTEVKSHHQVRIRITYATRLFQAWLYVPLCSDVESNRKRQRLKDGGALADVEHSTSLRGDEKYSRNKGLRSGHLSPSQEFPSLLPLSGGKLFTVPSEVRRNEWRPTGRENKTQWIEWRGRKKKTWRANRLLCWGQQKLE